MIIHTIAPVYDKNSKILILGSFPSVKSRESNFFYGNPQNRFWKVLARIYNENIPETIEEKKELLTKNHIAIWDVISSCEIQGSSDSTISNVTPNDLTEILKNSSINKIFVNGRKAEQLYQKYIEPSTSIKAIYLPSTSPANASMNLEKLISKWEYIIKDKIALKQNTNTF